MSESHKKYSADFHSTLNIFVNFWGKGMDPTKNK